MTWRRWLQSRTRNVTFLWRMVIAILLLGVIVGVAVDAAVPAWIHAPSEQTVVDGTPVDPSEPDDPTPEPQPFSYQRLKQLAEHGEWRAVWWTIPRTMVHDWSSVGATILAVLTGACWMAFAMQAIQPRGLRDGRLWLPLLGLALGVLSIWPTVFLIYWQEFVWGLVESRQLQAGLRDNILGVGLREELSKFVCFVPLLPWCVWRRDELAALMLAGCVGIGFGMEENVNYIHSSVAADAIGRMLMTVPLHMAWTGLLGLAAYRACVWPRQCIPQFVAMFVVIVMAHGVYDALLSITVLQDYSFFSVLIFLGTIYQFFSELRPKRSRRVESVSLTANFLFCVSTVAAAAFVYLAAAVGATAAGDMLVTGIVGQAVMVYLFLREMPETMVSV